MREVNEEVDLIGKIKTNLNFELEQLDNVILEYTKSDQSLIVEISDYIFKSGGKRIRPLITILSANLLNKFSGDKHILLAAAVEFIHTATLLHDDVVDESDLRRGNKSANLKFGSKQAILVGDYLFSQAFNLMSIASDAKTLSILATASAKIAEGEVNQLVNSTDIDLSFEKYIKVISGKTAELFAASSASGMSVAGGNDQMVEALYEYGLNLGILFQIIDDKLDYFASSDEFGKQIGNDFKEGKITLPIILLFESTKYSKEFKKIFEKKEFTDEKLKRVISVMRSENIPEKMNKIAKHYSNMARSAIKNLNLKESISSEILLEILDFSIDRMY